MTCTRHPMVQIPAGQIGVVIAQVGDAAAGRRQVGGLQAASSAISRTSTTFVDGGGQKGVQRPVLPPGTVVPIHPVGFLVITQATPSTACRSTRTMRRSSARAASSRNPSASSRCSSRSCASSRAFDRGRQDRRHDRHRHHLRRPAAAQGRHRQPHRRLRRSRGARERCPTPRTATWSRRSSR